MTETLRDFDVLAINSKFEEAVPQILQFIASSFSLTFIDPTGWTGHGLERIEPLLRHKPGEVILNFMYDYVNRFLGASTAASSFDDFLSRGRSALNEAPDREAAMLALYCQELGRAGDFEFVTSTRIKKPLAERSYFHLIYATRHYKGLVEFRGVEEKEIREQDVVRQDAQQIARMAKSGQFEIFSSTDRPTSGPMSFESERRRNLEIAAQRLVDLLPSEGTIAYEVILANLLTIPLVWAKDIQELIRSRAEVIGLAPRERSPKPSRGHRLRRK